MLVSDRRALMRDTAGFDGVKPSREPDRPCVSPGSSSISTLVCWPASLATRSSHARRVRRTEDVRHQAWTGYQPRHSVGRLHRPAFRAVRPQHRRARREAAKKDRSRSQAASTDRHRARRGLPLRRDDAVFVARAKAFHRRPGVAGRQRTPRQGAWERSPISGAARDFRGDGWSESADAGAARGAANLRTPVRAARLPLAIGIAALLVLIGGAGWWFVNANRPAAVASKAPAEAARLSIVVLPFANLSGDPAQDYLADALTDELTTALARIHDSFVIARNTAFTYKGKPVDAKAIGKDLGVRYVLEGSVQPTRTGAGSTPSSSTPTAARISGPSNSTPPAPICCRRRTRSSSVWRARWSFNSPRPRPPVSNGRPRQIPTPRIWLSSASGRTESRIYRQGSGCGLPSLRTGARRRSQQCPRAERWPSSSTCRSLLRPQRRPQGRPQAGGRTGVASARPRSKLRRGPQLKGLDTHSVRGASTKRSRKPNARSPWTRPRGSPMRAWAGTTCSSGNLKRASNF